MPEFFTVILFISAPIFPITLTNVPPPDPSLSSERIPVKENEVLLSPAELLERSPGAVVRKFTGSGAFSSISIRGNSSSTTLSYLEGIPLGDARFGIQDLGSIPTWALSEAHVFKSFTPPELRPAPGLSGVNFRLREVRGFQVDMYGGSFSTGGAHIFAGSRWGRTSFSAGAGYDYTKGNFAFLSNNGTPFNPSDDYVTLRKNNHHALGALFLRFSHNGKNLSAQSFVMSTFRESGLPGFDVIQNSRAKYTERGSTGGVKLKFSRTPLNLLLHFRTALKGFDDPLAEVGLLRERERSTLHELGLRAGVPVEISHWLVNVYAGFSEGGERGREEFQGQNYSYYTFSGFFNADVSRVFLGFRWIGRVRLTHFRLSANPIFSAFSSPLKRREWFFEPSAGILWRRNGRFEVFSNLGYTALTPTMAEVAGDRGFIAPNPDIPPERRFFIDAGLRVRDTFWRGTVASFFTYARDLHVFLQNSQYTVRADAIGSAITGGIEGSASFTWRIFSAGMSFTYLEAFDVGGVGWWRGKRVPGMPRFSGEVHVVCSLRKVDFKYSLRFEAQKYLDRANAKEVGPYFIHSISAMVRLYRDELALTFEARNLTGEREYDFMGFPLPGRSFYVKVILKIQKYHKEVAS